VWKVYFPLKPLLLIFKKKGNKILTNKEEKRITKDTVEELEPEQDDEVLTYSPLSLINPSMSLLPLHKKKRMRLLTFLFKIMTMPCFMI
jgi:hypothetical protein